MIKHTNAVSPFLKAVFFIFISVCLLSLVLSSPAFAWRSSMFPTNWTPVDKGAVTGVNVFNDSLGTKDEGGATVSGSDPRYHPKRYLHDFSYAGYHAGKDPIPPENPSWTNPGITVTVSCDKTGVTNCLPTIQNAINTVENNASGGVVYLPAGEYRLKRTTSGNDNFLNITKSNVVLRGAGSGVTKLLVDPYDKDGNFRMKDNRVITFGNGSMSNWTPVKNSENTKSITADLPLPTKVIPVNNTVGFKKGDQIIIYNDIAKDTFLDEHDMDGELPNEDDPGETLSEQGGEYGIWEKLGGFGYAFRRTIESVDATHIYIDVPTRYRIKVSDGAFVQRVNPGITEVGLEHLAIGVIRHPLIWNFEQQQASGENWRNYLFVFCDVSNGWIYDVKTYTPAANKSQLITKIATNSLYGTTKTFSYYVDYLNQGIIFKSCRFITVKNFQLRNSQTVPSPSPGSQALAGHTNGNGYAFTIFSSSEILVAGDPAADPAKDTIIEYVKKGFAFNRAASGNVIKDVKVRNIMFYPNDFHSGLSMANLIDNMTMPDTFWEAAVRPMDSGTFHGHGTTETVFWNTKGGSTAPITMGLDANIDWDRQTTAKEQGIIVSNQYGWGYIIGTYGPFSKVITPVWSNRRKLGQTNEYRPYVLPRDYAECISYDVSGDSKCQGSLEPRSLYEAQLALRLGTAVVAPPAVPSPAVPPDPAPTTDDGRIVLDNKDIGFSSTDIDWVVSLAAGAYPPNSVYSKNLDDKAIWGKSLKSGRYEVFAWWTAHANRATAAPYSIFSGETKLGEVKVDQRVSGGQWVSLGQFDFAEGSARVELTVAEDGKSHSADAVSFVPRTPVEKVIDNEEIGFTKTGNGWVVSQTEGPWENGSIISKTTGDKGSWRTTLPSGIYNVYAWWTAHSNRGTDATYKVYNSATATTPVISKTFNQTIDGGMWNLIGQFTSTGIGRVELTAVVSGKSYCADAIKFTPVVDTTKPSTPVVTDDGATTPVKTQLKATVSSADAESGIAEYQYKIVRDSVTGTMIQDWTGNGSSAAINATSLNLQDGKTYFILVKAINGAGLASSQGNSNGITVNAPVDKVVDNKDAGFTKSGTWTTSQAAGAYPVDTGDSVYSNVVNSTATWTTTLSSGTYQVYAWWTTTDNRATAAVYKVYNGSTFLASKTVNQTTAAGGGGKWNLLGSFTITATGKVTLTVTDGTKYYSADAIRFVK